MGLFSDIEALVEPHAGVDEVGRGPLAGAVVAAAVVLDPARPIEGLKDSKVLTAARREALAALIHRDALAVAIGRAEVAEIDDINIFQAAMLAMQRAVAALPLVPRVIYVDGNHAPPFGVQGVAIVGGDARVPAISAASIVAKVHRDHEMAALALHYPGYGFEQHKGYATAEHFAALNRLGATPLHRRSFAPVRTVLEGGTLNVAALGNATAADRAAADAATIDGAPPVRLRRSRRPEAS
jgi:ribonuclease HII